MGQLDVKHYLDIYETRLRMQEEGITNPPEPIKAFVREIVEKLSQLNPDEPLIHDNDGILKDSSGNILAVFPR